jgi:hypothetical protein
MNNKSIKPIVLLFLLFLVCAISFGFNSFYYSKNPGSLFTSIFLGVLFAWAIVAPIIRIKFGVVPFLTIFAAFPVCMLPILWAVNADLPSVSWFIVVLIFQVAFSLSYIGWLRGLRIFAVFKRSTWAHIFFDDQEAGAFNRSKSKQANKSELTGSQEGENIKPPSVIDRLYNEGQISLNEATKLRNKWAKLTEREKKEILETQG